MPAARAGVTFEQWSEWWIDSLVQVTPSTLQGYVSITRRRLQPRWGSTRLNAVTHADIQSWISDENSRVSARTVRSYHRVLSMILKYAIRDGRLSRNPADGVRLPRVRQKRHPYLTHAQLHELAALCGSEGLAVLFLGYTGLRWASWPRSNAEASTSTDGEWRSNVAWWSSRTDAWSAELQRAISGAACRSRRFSAISSKR